MLWEVDVLQRATADECTVANVAEERIGVNLDHFKVIAERKGKPVDVFDAARQSNIFQGVVPVERFVPNRGKRFWERHRFEVDAPGTQHGSRAGMVNKMDARRSSAQRKHRRERATPRFAEPHIKVPCTHTRRMRAEPEQTHAPRHPTPPKHHARAHTCG